MKNSTLVTFIWVGFMTCSLSILGYNFETFAYWWVIGISIGIIEIRINFEKIELLQDIVNKHANQKNK